MWSVERQRARVAGCVALAFGIVVFVFGIVVVVWCFVGREELPGLPRRIEGKPSTEFVNGLSCTIDDTRVLTGQELEEARRLLLTVLHTPPNPEEVRRHFGGSYCIAPDYCICYSSNGTPWFVIQVYPPWSLLVSQRPNITHLQPVGSQEIPGLRRIELTDDLEAQLGRVKKGGGEGDSHEWQIMGQRQIMEGK